MAGSSSYVHPERLRRYLRGVLQHYLALLFYLAGREIVAREVLLLQESFILVVVYAVNDFGFEGIAATAYIGDVVPLPHT